MKKIPLSILAILFFFPFLLMGQDCPVQIVCGSWDTNNSVPDLLLIYNNNDRVINKITLDLDELPKKTVYPTNGNGSGDITFHDIGGSCPSDHFLNGTITIEYEDGDVESCTYINSLWEDIGEYDCPISVTCSDVSVITQFEEGFYNAGTVSPYFYFSINEPNGIWNWDVIHSDPSNNIYEYYISTPGLNCDPANPGMDLTITYINGLQCVYEDGLLCETCDPGGDPSTTDPSCLDWLRTCNRDFVSFINEEIELEGCDQWIGKCGYSDRLYRNGPVGIGSGVSSIPEGYLLAVQRGIQTQQTKIAPCNGWCDYVFEKDYKLMPLVELAEFVKNKKHLPEMPSAKEVKEAKGFELGEMTKKQQVKIEEIYLHLIDLDQQLEALEDKADCAIENK